MERNFTGLRLVRAVLLACVLSGAVEVRAQIAQVMGRRYIKVIQPMELKGRELNPYRVYSLADAVRYYSGIQGSPPSMCAAWDLSAWGCSTMG